MIFSGQPLSGLPFSGGEEKHTWLTLTPLQSPGYSTLTPTQTPVYTEIIPTQDPDWVEI